MKPLVWIVPCLAVALSAALVAGPGGARQADKPKPNRYMGADTCKACHANDDSGNQFKVWSGMGHAQAYARLATEEAKAVAEKLGIEDPQKADQCLRCHATAWGEPEENVKKGFKFEDGVSCESCHGPGENHRKARLKAMMSGEAAEGYSTVPEGEIIVAPTHATCLRCHNKDNPTFESFCYFTYRDKIRHLDPRKPRTEADEKARLVCKHETPCTHELCTPDTECGVAASAKKAEGDGGD